VTSRRVSVPRYTRWGVCGVVGLVAVAVVWLARNPAPHTGGDNSGYVSLAYALLTTGSYTEIFDPEGLPHTKYPPVYPGLLAILIGLGARTWTTLKVTAAVPTILTVAIMYLWSERRLGTLGAAAVSVLLALSAGFVYYSQWILSDPLFVALTLASLYCLTRADEALGAEDRARDHDDAPVTARWLIAGVGGAGLAYFTRSAGLPLVVALLVWLALRARWRALAISFAALAAPMAAWSLRARGQGVAQYSTEFWMVDPYDPAAGTINVVGLVPRVLENLSLYVLQHVPAGVVGQGSQALPALGVAMTIAAIAGWLLTARRRIGPAEIFFPLYAGLVLLWPAVWGGDRFALPLYPLVFVYGALALRAAVSRLPSAAGSAIAAATLLVLLLPAGAAWLDMTRSSSACARIATERGPWACYGAGVTSFVAAATWTASGLPVGSAVLSRKPRHFFAISGHPSRAFPFEEGAAAHLALADRLGARYVLLDQWDGLAARYVAAAVRDMPGAFCYVGAFGDPSAGGSQLLGVLPPDTRRAGTSVEGIALSRCPDDYTTAGAFELDYSFSRRIPLLDGLGP